MSLKPHVRTDIRIALWRSWG